MQVQRKPKRIFTPEQKFQILSDIDRCLSIKDGLAKHQITSSLYYKWKRQLEVGVNASLRNSKPIKPQETKDLQRENRLLKEMVLNLSHQVCELKKTLSLGQ
jgi:transposase-like protein